MRLIGDERGIIVGWILKLLLGFALFGLVLFEAGAIIVSRVSVDSVAVEAAQEAGLEYKRTRSTSKAEAVAERFAGRNGATLTDFRILNDGDRVQVTVEKEASTLVADLIPGLKVLTVAEATNSAGVV